jgi:hypothetical protein
MTLAPKHAVGPRQSFSSYSNDCNRIQSNTVVTNSRHVYYLRLAPETTNTYLIVRVCREQAAGPYEKRHA